MLIVGLQCTIRSQHSPNVAWFQIDPPLDKVLFINNFFFFIHQFQEILIELFIQLLKIFSLNFWFTELSMQNLMPVFFSHIFKAIILLANNNTTEGKTFVYPFSLILIYYFYQQTNLEFNKQKILERDNIEKTKLKKRAQCLKDSTQKNQSIGLPDGFVTDVRFLLYFR